MLTNFSASPSQFISIFLSMITLNLFSAKRGNKNSLNFWIKSALKASLRFLIRIYESIFYLKNKNTLGLLILMMLFCSEVSSN